MYNEERFVKTLIDILIEKKISTDRIHLQKITAYLSDNMEDVPFRFGIYTYGPFSTDLSSVLSTMKNWDDLYYEDKIGYSINSKTAIQSLEQKDINIISDKIDKFCAVLPSDKDFRVMELYGTMYYYMFRTNPIEETAVFKKFKAVKNGKFNDSELKTAFNKLRMLV
ncbi:MAG: hypothetical protein LBT79_02735 [Elusimicrobiota bacterium]|nr:hypothetical protein [Elusimicrobiota bacterium]